MGLRALLGTASHFCEVVVLKLRISGIRYQVSDFGFLVPHADGEVDGEDILLGHLDHQCLRRRVLRQVAGLLMSEFIKEDSPFYLTRTITGTVIGPCYTPLSLAPRDAARRWVSV